MNKKAIKAKLAEPRAKLKLRADAAELDFWTYCKLDSPTFYREDRPHLKTMCDELQDFVESDDEVMVLNAPPRHGKSRTVSLLASWYLGKNKTKKVMTGSYNEMLSTTFSKSVRNKILEIKADQDRIVFSDIFPGVVIKQGDAAMNLWSLQDGYNSYLATSPTGTATGFGADIEMIDDLIKSALEANNAAVLEAHWEWFSNTMLSRLEEGGKIIIVMTRWSTKDLAGRVLSWCRAEHKSCRHVKLKAHLGNGKMLCPEILSYNSYLGKISAMSREIVLANYDQDPIDLKGRLYGVFKTYEKIPHGSSGEPIFSSIRAYTDTADEGKDYLCQIIYGVVGKYGYVLDVYYTKDPMEITEEECARRLKECRARVAKIESNNGGRGFGRQVKRHLERSGWNGTTVKMFTQSKNKTSRILSNATSVMECIIMPAGWEHRWPEYYDAMAGYQRDGKNAHDDAQDTTTGVVEDLLGLDTKHDYEEQYNAIKALGL